MKQKNFAISGVRLLLLVFFGVTVFLPLLSMLSQIQWGQIPALVQKENFQQVFLHSLAVSTLATLISVALAYLLAYAIHRTRIPCKKALTVLLTLPMLIPSISHGIGLINLFGSNGLLTRALNLSFDIYGFWGIVLGSVLYSFPVAFLMLSDAMNYADGSLYEAAKVLGIPKGSIFFCVTVQYMKRPLVSALFAVFVMVFTDYGVPLSVGGRYTTLPVYLYQEVIGLMDYSRGAFIGLILLIPAIIAFLLDLKKKDEHGLGFVARPVVVEKNRLRDVCFGLFTLAVVLCVLVVLSSFGIMSVLTKYPYDLSLTTAHIETVLQKGLLEYLGNSLVIALSTAVIGTVVAYGSAYLTARTPGSWSNKLLHLVSISSIAIPGIVLGLGYAICFSPTFLAGTITLLALVNVIHFFSSPYLMALNAMKKLNENLEDVGKTLQVGRLRLLRDVFLPNTVDTVAEMFSYFFVNAMITISAVAFLYRTATMPLSMLISQMESSMLFEAAAFISLVILGANLLVKGAVGLVKWGYRRALTR